VLLSRAATVSDFRPQQLIIADIIFKVQNQAYLHFKGTFLLLKVQKGPFSHFQH